MSFFDEAARAKTYLREHGRVSMRALRRGFALDDAALDELVEELVEVQQVAVREGPVLVSTAAARSEGATVDRPIDASTPVVTPSPESGDIERRQLTVLFCDAIYAWFTEGFDTRDLIDAKALLEALSR